MAFQIVGTKYNGDKRMNQYLLDGEADAANLPATDEVGSVAIAPTDGKAYVLTPGRSWSEMADGMADQLAKAILIES